MSLDFLVFAHIFAYVSTNERTNERTKFICQWTDWTQWLLVTSTGRSPAHQSWPPKKRNWQTNKKRKTEKEREKETKYIHTIAADKYKEKLLILELHHHTLDHIELVKYNHSDMFSNKNRIMMIILMMMILKHYMWVYISYWSIL